MSNLPRKTPHAMRYAKFATRGVLTRMALMFQANKDQTFTGDEVAEILVAACIAIQGQPDMELPDSATLEALKA